MGLCNRCTGILQAYIGRVRKEGEGRWGRGRKEKGGGERKCKEAKVK